MAHMRLYDRESEHTGIANPLQTLSLTKQGIRLKQTLRRRTVVAGFVKV